jgi:hypothetical protein
VVGRDPLHRRDDDLAGPILGFVASGFLDCLADSDALAIRFVADGFEELCLCLHGAHAADAFQCGDVFLLRPGELLAELLELALAIQKLAVTLLEHVGALVELVIAS